MCPEESSKPFRCTSTGRKCDGYIQSPEDALERPQGEQHKSLSLHGVSSHQHLGGNVHYLEFYHRCTAPSISSRFDKKFWSRVPLQMAQSELSVRHALIALSYLNKSETGTLKNARAGLVTVSEQKTMLLHYNKAVKHLVQRMSESSYSAELGLVCCLLFICLEFLRGNYDTAMVHYTSGLNIISAYKNKHPTGSIRSLRSNMVEETLIPMFMRNMATGIMFGLPSDQVSFSSHYPVGTQECVFNTVLDADLSAHNIRNMGFLLARILGTKIVSGEPHTKEDLQLQQDCLEHHRVWMHAFDKFLRETNLPQEDVIAAHLLKALHWTNYIFAARILLTAQTDFDQHLDDFKATIGYTRIVLDSMDWKKSSRESAANFTFDIGIILSLYLTTCRCRCPITRREALSLLERDLPREGLWDAQQHALVARRVIEYEEREVDPVTGWPVERQRIWSTMIRGEMDGNGRFPVDFVIGHWGEGRGTPPLPPGGVLPHDPNGTIWREWFVL
jgi:hypothetical protein